MAPGKYSGRLSMIIIISMIIGLFSFTGTVSSAGVQPKEITIACSQDNYPFHFAGEDGKAAGITIDFWNLWSKKTGIKVNYLISDWETTLRNMKDQKADIHAGCFYTNERDTYMEYGFPIVEAETHIFYSSNLKNIRALGDLRPFTIGLIRDDYSETYVRATMVDPSIRMFDSYEEIIAAAMDGSIQVFVADTLTALSVMEKTMPKGLFTYNADQPLYTNYFYAAAQEGKADLVNRINAGMGSITQDERAAILDRWFPRNGGGMSSVKVAISTDYPPFAFLDGNEKPQGFLVDMWRLWGKKTSTDIQFVTGSWANAVMDVTNGTADIHSGLFYTDERSKAMNFSRMFYEVDSKIFINAKQRSFKSANDLKGKLIGAKKGSYQEAYMKERYPNLTVVGFDYSTSMVEAADYGLIDGFIEESVALKGSYQVSGKEFNDVALPDVSFKRDMLAGITKSKPELLEKVNAGIKKITQEEWQSLEEKWIKDPSDRIFKEPVDLKLTDTEKAWIINHPVLRIGADKHQNPLEYQQGGLPKGISIEYAQYILERIGIKPEIRQMEWPDILNGIRTGENLDVSFNIQKTDERSEYLTFSRPYLNIPQMIATRLDKKMINSFSELKGLTVAVERGYYKIGHFKKDKSIELLMVDSPQEALLAVSSGRADAYIGDNLTVTYTINSNSLKNLRVSEYKDMGTYDVSIGFRKELAPLASIINKVLDAMTESEKKDILTKYTGLTEEGAIFLSDSEKEWLRNHNKVRAGMQTGWAPIEFQNELNEMAGVSTDYSSLVERMLSVQLIPVTSSTYSELVGMMMSGKIDILTAAVKSPYKSKYMNFSKPYLISPMTLITLDESPFVGGMNNISDERVGVIQEGFAEDMLKIHYANVVYQSYPDENHLYQALSDGEVDLILDSMVSIDYMSRLKGISNLRVSNITEYNYEICIGIRRDLQTMLSLVNKVFDSVTILEKDSSEKYWLGKLPPDRQFWERYQNLIKSITGVIVLIVGLIVFWNRKLQAEINERKLVEIELKGAKEAADVASRSKTEFLANMSHEIRTPMNAVIGMATLMNRTDLSLKQRDYLTKISQATYNLLNIINGILDFSKIEAGKMDLEEVEFELDAVLEHVASIIGIRAKDKNIELIISKDGGIPLRMVGDPLRLEQVLINLASNAIKFTHDGEVEIKIGSTRWDNGQVTLVFSVRDTGIGMEEDQISRLFKPFTQSDSSTTRRFGGTGLGLSISKKLVELMGGRIWATCQLGIGCIFNFEITLRYVQGSDPIYAVQSGDLGNLRVMVVEDNPSAREVMEGYLNDFNFRPSSFESGEAALESFKTQDYDLVLMDWKLQGVDGLQTSRMIQALNLAHQPKIIMVTAYGDEDLMDELKGEGLDGVLLKPINESVLFNAIHNIFSEEADHEKWSVPLRLQLNESFLEGQTILVVEDNVLNQQLARELLESAGAKVGIAGNGQAALDHLLKTEEGYNLIFMDLQMPEMDGFESTLRVRELERWSDTPIIAMTADVLSGIYESCINSGMNDYISKPINVEELYDKLANWLEIKESYYKPALQDKEPRLSMDIEDLDTESAINKLGGSIELYKRVIERFIESYDNFDSDILRFRRIEFKEDALRYFHTLKGHGGNIGSGIIAEEAEMAERFLENSENEEFKGVIDSLGRHIRKLVNELKKTRNESIHPMKQTNPWILEDLVEHLETLVQKIKARKPAEIKEGITGLFEKRLPEESVDACKTIKKLCDRYKYKEATSVIEGLTESLKIS